MIDNLSKEQIQGIMDVLPIDIMFADENDRAQYRNKEETRLIKSEETLGKDIRGCHNENSLPKVEKILSDFKSGERDEAEFWIMGLDRKILNRFIAVRDMSGKYLGILEYLLDFTAIEEIAQKKKDADQFWASRSED